MKPYQCVSGVHLGVRGHVTAVGYVTSSSTLTSDPSMAGCNSRRDDLASCDLPSGLAVGLPGAYALQWSWDDSLPAWCVCVCLCVCTCI